MEDARRTTEACLRDVERVRALYVAELRNLQRVDRWLWLLVLAVALIVVAFGAAVSLGGGFSWVLLFLLALGAIAAAQRALSAMRREGALALALLHTTQFVSELRHLLQSCDRIGCEQLERVSAGLGTLERIRGLLVGGRSGS